MFKISSLFPLAYPAYRRPLDPVLVLFKSGEKEATE